MAGMESQPLPDRLPESVCEVIPGLLYVGGAAAASEMVRRWNVRFVVRCVEEPNQEMYQGELDAMWLETCRARTNDVGGNMHGAVAEELDPMTCCHDQREADCPTSDAATVDDVDTDASTSSHSAHYGRPTLPPTDAEWLQQRPEAFTARVMHCPLEDTMTYSLLDSDVFQEALRFLDESLALCREGDQGVDAMEPEAAADDDGAPTLSSPSRAVYVHCLAGRSRSPAVVLAFLITRQRMTLQDALDMLAPTMRPNPNFIRQLMALETEALGSPPSKSSATNHHRQPFDLRQYFIEGLMQMHPSLSEATVVDAVDRCGGDIEVARFVLTKAAFEASRHKVAVECLCRMVGAATEGSPPAERQQTLSEATVAEVYEACHRNRHMALQRLLQMAEGLRGVGGE